MGKYSSFVYGTPDSILRALPQEESSWVPGSYADYMRQSASLGDGANPQEEFLRSAYRPDYADSLYQSIVTQESSGRTAVVNPDSGAVGMGQVMPFNIGPWTREILGRELTPD